MDLLVFLDLKYGSYNSSLNSYNVFKYSRNFTVILQQDFKKSAKHWWRIPPVFILSSRNQIVGRGENNHFSPPPMLNWRTWPILLLLFPSPPPPSLFLPLYKKILFTLRSLSFSLFFRCAIPSAKIYQNLKLLMQHK